MTLYSRKTVVKGGGGGEEKEGQVGGVVGVESTGRLHLLCKYAADDDDDGDAVWLVSFGCC